jgi:hypothetical protein
VINKCKRHGKQVFTEPNKNGMSFCLRCLALAVKRRPKEFSITPEFQQMLNREGMP